MPLFKFKFDSEALDIQATLTHELSTFHEAANVAVNAVSQFIGSNVPPPSLLKIDIYDEHDIWLAQVENKFEVRLARERMS